MIFCAEFTAAIDAAGTTTTLLVANTPFATEAGDTPANTAARNRLMQPGNFARSISGDMALLGLTRTQHGEMVFSNIDGAIDAWANYGVGDRTVTLRCCETLPGTYPTGWTTVFVCTAEDIRATRDTIVLRLKELTAKLDKPMCALFEGTGDIEGPATMQGDPVPKAFGAVYNVSPTLVDAQNLIYRVSSRGSIAANHAKDDGSVIARALTAGDDGDAATVDQDAYETYAALAAATVPRGHYVTLASLGLLRLGSVPVGQLTADLHEYTGPAGAAFGAGDRWATGGTGTAGQDISCYWGNVIKAMALDAGIASGDITAADVTAAGTGQYGYYACDTSTTYAQAINAIATSAAAWCGFDRTGKLRMATVEDPAASATLTYDITRDNAISIEPVVPKNGTTVPAWKCVIKYPKNYTPQSAFAGIVPDDVRAEASKEWPRSKFYRETATLDQHTNASTLEIERHSAAYRVSSDGDLNVLGDENTFVTNLVNLFAVQRQWFEVKLPFSIDLVTNADIGGYADVTWDRFGLTPQKNFLIVGVRYELSKDPWVALTLWG